MAIILAMFGWNSVSACPAYLTAGESILSRVPRENLQLFVITDHKSPTPWRAVGVQVDPMDADGYIDFPKNADWRRKYLQATDRLAMRVEKFESLKWQASDGLPCGATNVVEIFDPKHPEHRAYLAGCAQSQSNALKFPVQIDESKMQVTSDSYEYHYNPANHLMFSRVLARDQKTNTMLAVSSDSEQHIRADVRKFFTLNFKSKDILSKLHDVRQGALGLVGRLSFYLKILFFKIDLELSTGVSFFTDAVHVPMVIFFPVNSVEYVYPGTGLLFDWLSATDVVHWDIKPESMPALQPEMVLKSPEDLSKLGLNYCDATTCRYEMAGKVGEQRFAMLFRIPRPLVELGFFPLYVAKSAEAKVGLKWIKKMDDSALGRMGFYFETSRLPAGGHQWDLWIRLGGVSAPGDECPRVVKFGTVLP